MANESDAPRPRLEVDDKVRSRNLFSSMLSHLWKAKETLEKERSCTTKLEVINAEIQLRSAKLETEERIRAIRRAQEQGGIPTIAKPVILWKPARHTSNSEKLLQLASDTLQNKLDSALLELERIEKKIADIRDGVRRDALLSDEDKVQRSSPG